MCSEVRIGPRERLVLTAIIESYIATGEPIASQTVARAFDNKDGMSSATIRNVMSALGEAGWLEQPHASAGRIPTAKAFRFYVEQLRGVSRASKVAMDPELRDQIEEGFAGVSSHQQFLERTSHVLALVSSGVGLAMTAGLHSDPLDHVHFSRLSTGRVLAVVVTKGGLVLDRVLRLDRDLSIAELESAAAYLNQNFRGWPVANVRTEINRRMEQERNEYDRRMRSIEELCSKGALSQDGGGQSVFVEGLGNLIAREVGSEQLRQLLGALEAKQRLVNLLDAYVNACERAVRVVVGLEDIMPEMHDLVLIGAPVLLGMQNLGTVAVIGPTRIQYQETIDAITYISQLSGRILQAPQ
jgi:heat-inducible transcriptional repressor